MQPTYEVRPPSSSWMPWTSTSHYMPDPSITSMTFGMGGLSMSHGMAGPSSQHGMAGPSTQPITDTFQTPVQIPRHRDEDEDEDEDEEGLEARPRRVVAPGRQLQPPFTQQPATTDPPARNRPRTRGGRAEGRGGPRMRGGRGPRGKGLAQQQTGPEESEVLRVLRTTGFPPRCRIRFLPDEVGPSWWITLLAGDTVGEYLPTVLVHCFNYQVGYNI